MGRLNLALVRDEAWPLLELRGDPEIFNRFEQLRQKLHSRLG